MIDVQNVSLGYGRGPLVLEDVSFHLKPGSFHFLTGPSGSGKSTLLRLMSLTLRPTTGRLRMFGEDIAVLSPEQRGRLRQRVGMVLQDFLMLDYLTVYENAALPLVVVGKRDAEVREDVVDFLQWVGLGDKVHEYPSTLSGGQKQRAAIVRACIGKPELILADEPTGNVDPQMARRLLRLFVELNRLGSTVVIATHDHQLMRQFRAPRLELHERHVRVI